MKPEWRDEAEASPPISGFTTLARTFVKQPTGSYRLQGNRPNTAKAKPHKSIGYGPQGEHTEPAA